MQLESRQLAMLVEMGIPVWELRTEQSVDILPVAELTVPVLNENLLQRDWFILVEQQIMNEQEQRLLYAMLSTIDVTRQQINIVTLEQLPQIEQVPAKGKLLFVLGSTNLQLLLGGDSSRGEVHQTLSSGVVTVVSFSLKELLESPERKVLAWQDLQLAKLSYEQGR